MKLKKKQQNPVDQIKNKCLSMYVIDIALL